MEHIESIWSSDSKLQIESICSIWNRSRNWDIFKKCKFRKKGDLDDANDLVQRKETTIVDQFKKIEELIIHDGKAEIEIASLRDKNASLSKSMTQLGSALDDQTRENNRTFGFWNFR